MKIQRAPLIKFAVYGVLVALAVVLIGLVIDARRDAGQTRQIAEVNSIRSETNRDILNRMIVTQVVACRRQADTRRQQHVLARNQQDVLKTTLSLYKPGGSPYADKFPEQAAAKLKIYQRDLKALKILPIPDCFTLKADLMAVIGEN